MQTFKIEVNLNELNVILQSLGNMPFTAVYEIIYKIKNQAEPQIDIKNKD